MTTFVKSTLEAGPAKIQWAPLIIVGTLAVAALVWLILCMLSGAFLQWLIPVSEHDLQMASWHPGVGTYVMTNWFTSVASLLLACMSLMFGVLVMLSSVGQGRVRWGVLVYVVICGVGIFSSTRMEVAFLSAVDANVAKVGCFVPEIRECKEMLRLPDAQKAPSRYISDRSVDAGMQNSIQVRAEGLQDYGNSTLDSVDYLRSVRAANKGTAPGTLKFEVPGLWWFSLPLTLLHGDEILKKLELQRQWVREATSKQAI